MKVKIGNKIYDGEKEPVMIIMNETEKKQIANMSKRDKKYCVYPSNEYWTDNNYEKIKEWMDE